MIGSEVYMVESRKDTRSLMARIVRPHAFALLDPDKHVVTDVKLAVVVAHGQ